MPVRNFPLRDKSLENNLESIKKVFEEGYLSGRVCTQILDQAMNADRVCFKNGKWYYDEGQTPLKFKESSTFLPFWMRRVFHKVLLHVSSTYKANFEKTITKIAEVAVRTGISVKEWVDRKENKLTKQKAATFVSQNPCFYEMYGKACQLVKEENVEAAFLLAKTFLTEKAQKKIYSDLIDILLKKRPLSKVTVQQALEIALDIAPKIKLNFQTFEAEFGEKPFHKQMKEAFHQLVKNKDIESAFLIARPFLSKKEKEKYYPTFVANLLAKENKKLALEVVLGLPVGEAKSQCIQQLFNASSPSEIPQLRMDLGIPLNFNFELAKETAGEGNIAGTLLLVSSLSFVDKEKKVIYATLINSILHSEFPEKDDIIKGKEVIKKISDKLMLQQVASALADMGNISGTQLVIESLTSMTEKTKSKIYVKLIKSLLTKEELTGQKITKIHQIISQIPVTDSP